MKVYKALKKKKSMVHAIVQLTELIQASNSIPVDNEFEFEVNELLQKRQEKVLALIELKQRLSKTAVGIQGKIFELSELKLSLQMLKNIDTTKGATTIGYSDTVVSKKVQLGKAEILGLIERNVEKIDAIQSEIDEFNYSTELL